MSYSNGKISPPISIADVKAVLGSSSNDLGSLCQSAYINKWAKYKPVIVSQLLTTKDNWFKADANTYGFNIPSFSSPTAVLQAYENGTHHWTYMKPSGGMSSPFRLTDFNGYNHNALAPMRSQATTATTYYDTSAIGVSYITQISIDSDTVGLEDLGLGGYYMTAAMFTSDGTFAWIGSSGLISNEGVSNILLDPAKKTTGTTWALGKYKIVPMLCSYNYSKVTNTLYQATYIPIDVGKVVDIEIKSSSSLVSDKIKSITAKHELGYTVTLIIKENVTAIKSATVYFVHTSDPSKGDSMLVGESYKTLTNLEAGKTYSFFYAGNSSYSNYKAYVYADDVWVSKGLQFISSVMPDADEESSDEATTTSETEENQSVTT